MLEQYLIERRKGRDVALMTHIVIGYPSFEASMDTVAAMVDAGVDLIEMQIPFSEPIADGPVILHANQKALAAGATVERCFEFAAEAVRRFDVPILFMSYYNILYRYGTEKFVKRMAELGLRGAIVPDLPPEEARDYLRAMNEHALDPIFIYSPNTPNDRLAFIAEHAKGFIYCVARKGVTGTATDFSVGMDAYLKRCRDATALPLAVGFGVKDEADVEFLVGKADVAVVGSQTIRVLDEEGVEAVGDFVRSLINGVN